MRFHIDQEFLDHFKGLHQVFLYLTDECNLRCSLCEYKPSISFHLKEREIGLETATDLIADFKEMGASKLSLVGGEPTLYGASRGNRPLLDVIDGAKDMGYEHVCMVTNGMFQGSLLAREQLRRLDELTFSLDGFTAEINDPLRGRGTFDRCVSNVRRAVELGYRVGIKSNAHQGLLQRGEGGALPLDAMVRFAASLGAAFIDIHSPCGCGVPMDAWTGGQGVCIEEWIGVYRELRGHIDSGEYHISVRLPQCYVTRQEFERDMEYYSYCAAKMGERLLVHPDGMLRICPALLSTPYGVARFYDDRIAWDRSSTNELVSHRLAMPTPCTNRGKGAAPGNYMPLCLHFKPGQDEFVWNEQLDWEGRRRVYQARELPGPVTPVG